MDWEKELGILHNHAKQFKGGIKNPWSFIQNIEYSLPMDDVDLKNKWEQIKAHLLRVSSELEKSIIYFDFELDNLLWNERCIHIIDFEGYQFS
ncbi:Ser/Thr protein kinase RdoA (MazF antagonist) [Bacillus pakistanensis]|uniref:Ser/Thr protein kinase RdoA (MazF antagonist) n=2 Tax=Rossellomorea pakistanensis TaxID=992288 RepID=A0ABS2N7L0_9BACI|nr:Ser/Thr protein kinase RdoA (MazF antagonist) [Bacillus pakistanensis]